MNIVETRNKIAQAATEFRAILEKSERENRDLTDAEDTRCTALHNEIKELQKSTARYDELYHVEEELRQPASGSLRGMPDGIAGTGGVFPGQFPGNARGVNMDNAGFGGGVAEFLHSLAVMKSTGARDERLARLENRDQQMGVGAAGGFNVPPSFDSTLRFVQPDEAIFRPRATIIGGNSNAPSAPTSFPALDQTNSVGTPSVYGGVIISNGAESVSIQETSAKFREITLEPHQKSAYVPISNKLLYNWSGSGGVIANLLRQAVLGSEDTDFMVGNGVNKSLGAYGASCAITYPRNTANSIVFSDVVGMLARVLRRPGDQLVWVASPTCLPSLCSMVDSGGHAVYLGGALSNAGAGAVPTGLLGIPVMYSERAPALGTKGDLALLSPRYYCIQNGLQLMAMSEHVLFLSDRVVFRIVWEVDGRPWLTEPLQLEGAPGSTVSPFIILSA